MSNLTKKIIEVQRKLIAPKSNFNNFGKYKYRSAEDILEAVKPLNAEHGLLLTLTDEPILIGDWHYIKAMAEITDGEEVHIVTAYARESEHKKGMDSSQVTGTASSYARKYALNGLYLIDDTKDADTDEYRNQNNKQQNAPDPLNNEIITKFSEALQTVGDKAQLYEILKTNKNKMDALIKSKSKKQKEEMINQLEGIKNDYRSA